MFDGSGFYRNNKTYFQVLFSQLLSRFGDSIETLALMMLVLKITSSPFYMGLVAVISMIPNIVCAPLAGVFADRHDRVKIMRIAECARAVIILVIPIGLILGLLNVYLIFIVCGLLSIFETFFQSSFQAQLPLMFDDDKVLTQAYSLQSSGTSILQILGYATGGILLQYISYEALFIFDSFTFLVSALAIKSLRRTKLPGIIKTNQAKQSMLAEIVDGVAYMLKNRVFMLIILTGFFVNFLLAPVELLLSYGLIYVHKMDSTVLGFSIAVLLIGILVGNLLFPFISKRLKDRFILSFSVILIGPCYALGAFFNNPYSLVIGFALAAVFTGMASLSVSTLFATSVSDEFRGRSGALLNMGLTVSNPLGAGICGAALSLIGLGGVLGSGGLIIMLAGLSALAFWPRERQLVALID